MIMENQYGPILTDKELFDALDYSAEGLSPVLSAVNAGDNAAARHAFAEYFRNFLKPEKYFSIPGKNIKPNFTDDLKNAAERALRHEMKSCNTPMKFDGKVDWFANPTYNQYKEWTVQLSRHDELFRLAAAYRASGDERYAEGCAELFDSWVKQAVRPELTANGYMTLCWRTIECGIRMGLIWPEIIHSFIHSPAFTDDILIDWCKSVYEHSVRLITNPTSGNWLIHELNGLTQNGIFYPFFKDAKKWRDYGFTRLSEELDKQIYPDGFQYELTTGYQGVVISHYMAVMEVAVAYGYDIPQKFYDTIEKMLNIYILIMLSNGRIPNINDGGDGSAKGYVLKYARYFPNNENIRWLVTDGKEGKEPDYRSVLLPYSGMVAFRTGWTGDDITGFFDAGPFGAGHQHEDKLNFIICTNGRNILAEADVYAYDTSEMRKYVLSTRGHNTIRVNGQDQNRRRGYAWQPSMLHERSNAKLSVTEEFDTAWGCYDEGYGEDQEKYARHERTVILAKKPKLGRPFFIAVDRLFADRTNTYESIWHFGVLELTVTENCVKGDDITAFFCGDVGDMKTVTGAYEPEVQGWTCRGLQDSNRPIPTLLHTVEGKNVCTVTLFSVHDESGSSPISSVKLDKDTVTVNYVNGDFDNIKI